MKCDPSMGRTAWRSENAAPCEDPNSSPCKCISCFGRQQLYIMYRLSVRGSIMWEANWRDRTSRRMCTGSNYKQRGIRGAIVFLPPIKKRKGVFDRVTITLCRYYVGYFINCLTYAYSVLHAPFRQLTLLQSVGDQWIVSHCCPVAYYFVTRHSRTCLSANVFLDDHLIPLQNGFSQLSESWGLWSFAGMMFSNYTGQQRFCPMRKKVCCWCSFGRWIRIYFQNFSIIHTFRVASDYVKLQAYMCESLGPVGGSLDVV